MGIILCRTPDYINLFHHFAIAVHTRVPTIQLDSWLDSPPTLPGLYRTIAPNVLPRLA
jgi:hypothetical protein